MDWNGITPVDGTTFEICITGPSYPGGDCKIFTYPADLVKEWCDLVPGVYTVSETDPGSMWTVVIDDSGATVPDDDGYVYATVTNTFTPGRITVCKQTVPLGSTQPFTFTTDYYANPFTLTDGECDTSDWLVAGIYDITEMVPVDWDLTNIMIVGDTDSGSIIDLDNNKITVDLDSGEDITVTFINHKCEYEVIKEVWDESSTSWVDHIIVPVGTILNFRITITCTGGSLHNLVVTDTMSEQLEYRNNANYLEYSISSDRRQVIWIFDQLNYGETIEITFNAASVEICNGWNHVIVTTEEQVIYEDTVTVKTIYVPNYMEITKKVWDGTQWVDSATFSGTGIVQFKITVINKAGIDLTNVLVTADLPSFMAYYFYPGFFPRPISSSSNHIDWYLGTLPHGFCIDIKYLAIIDSAGVEGDVYAFGIANCGPNIVSDSDSVHVIVE